MSDNNNKNSILEIKDVSVSFKDMPVLSGINIHLDKGELVSLLGKSGSGKTTLFNVIAGLLSPDSGQVLLKGEDIIGKPGNVSYMLQKDLLLPFRTIEDNVALPLLMRGMDKKEARKKATEHFSDFGLEGTEKKYPKQLSGGMRQRAALLRTYMFSQEIALLDEPFSALDTFTKHQMHNWYLDVLNDIKLTTLFITHDIDEAILLSDRIYLLSGQPGVIEDEIKVSRDGLSREEFLLSQKFIDYKREILGIL